MNIKQLLGVRIRNPKDRYSVGRSYSIFIGDTRHIIYYSFLYINPNGKFYYEKVWMIMIEEEVKWTLRVFWDYV